MPLGRVLLALTPPDHAGRGGQRPASCRRRPRPRPAPRGVSGTAGASATRLWGAAAPMAQRRGRPAVAA